MDEYNQDYENECPECGHSPLHFRDCQNYCDDGYFDEYEDDPINYAPGESITICTDCWGSGIETWCPKCGLNISKFEHEAGQ